MNVKKLIRAQSKNKISSQLLANAKDKGIFRNMVKYDKLDTNAFDRLFGIGWDVDLERLINNEQTVEFIKTIILC